MVHLDKPTTDYPKKALDRLNGNTVQSDKEAFEQLTARLNVVFNELATFSIAAAIRDYVNAVASRVRPEDRGDVK